jgi:hypothetical protein
MIVDQAIQTTPLKPPEGRLAVKIKKRGEGHPAFALDLFV